MKRQLTETLSCRGCGRLPIDQVPPDSIAYTCSYCLMGLAAKAEEAVSEVDVVKNQGVRSALRPTPSPAAQTPEVPAASKTGFALQRNRGGPPPLDDAERRRRKRERVRRWRAGKMAKGAGRPPAAESSSPAGRTS